MHFRFQQVFWITGVMFGSLFLLAYSPNVAHAQEQVALVIESTDTIFDHGFEPQYPDVAIKTFTVNGEASPSNPIDTTATINWDAINVGSCRASSTPGDSVTGWNASVDIGITGPQEVTFPGEGIYGLHLECDGLGDSTDSAVIIVQVGQTVITAFTVTPDKADIGTEQRFDLEWSSTNASDGCYGSWPDSPDLPASGSDSVMVTNVQPGTEFKLICSSPFGGDESTVTVTVNDPSVCDVSLESGYFRSWELSFASAFPGPNFTRVAFAYVPSDGYTAYFFETGDAEDDGNVATFQANGTSGSRLISISEVPGCFDVDPKCKAVPRDTSIEWDTTGVSETACQLKQNTTYYWNITFTDGISPESTRCTNDCYAGLIVNNPDYTE